MVATTRVDIPRSDVVGSLLRPAYLRDARRALREGKLSATELRTVEDRAVLEDQPVGHRHHFLEKRLV